jgi:nucleotide-binding universal stress UspA family protein
MAIRTIMIAFDFSEPAAQALHWADALAQATGAHLEVVHVYPDFEQDVRQAETHAPAADYQIERYLRFLQQELHEAARPLLGTRAETLGFHVLRGDAGKRLLNSAQELQADLIVVGATGKGRAERMMLGSVSEFLLRSSSVPVAIVR